MIVLFPPHEIGAISSSISRPRSSTPPNIYPSSLGNKLQRLALTRPHKLQLLESVVDKWLADDEGEAS